MDYKDTLNLANSDFPMRGNLPQNEPKTYEIWREERAFEKMKAKRQNQHEFVLHDGPPYANGHLHIGHALNKILKDIIIKYHYFQGDRVYYTPGWDCHGLPIEQKIEQNIGSTKKATMPKAEFRNLCRNHAREFIDIQSKEFQSLGVLGDFHNPYITMDYEFEAKIFESLCDIAKQGILAQRHKPIYWSWACQTALAEAEVEYKDKESHSIFVAFNLGSEALKAIGADKASIVIWTTTPWTLPANVAIALKPNESYVLTSSTHIVAEKLYEKLKDSLHLGEIVKRFNSNILERLEAINPLNKRPSMLILGEHVSLEDGSGAVHTATGHGEDDYYAGLKYDLEVLVPVDDYGNFDESIKTKNLLPSEFIGVNVFSAQEKILELLGSSLLKHSKIIHSYPHCWRSHKPVIYRATTQWFILMDKPFFEGKTLRQIALEEIEKVEFYPKSGYKRLKSMIENRPDWCISRQRDWGVPIAFFHDKATKEPIFDDELFAHLCGIFRQNGLNCWWDKEIVDLLPTKWKDRADSLYKGEHILDVWFDSGSTWNAVLGNPKYSAGDYPADMYLEGSDQHRGWFQSSLLVSCAIKHQAPYKSILTHGFTIDENNDKMSKSKGNVIAPEFILKEYGSEILRLWVALSDYQSDLKISTNILKQVSEQYKKIRNTLRFLLANTNDFSGKWADNADLSEIDKWILSHTNLVCDEAHSLFCQYEFSKAFNVIMNYLTNELSGIYLDLCKDSLYCDDRDDKRRLAIQTTLCWITRKLFVLLAPILTYTIDEAISYANIYLKGEWSDVFDCVNLEIPYNLGHIDFDELLELRAILSKEIDRLKKDKIIKSSLELAISGMDNVDFLPTWLIVSEDLSHNAVPSSNNAESILTQFSLKSGKEICVYKSSLFKCPRCWRFSAKAQDALCTRCESVIKNYNK